MNMILSKNFHHCKSHKNHDRISTHIIVKIIVSIYDSKIMTNIKNTFYEERNTRYHERILSNKKKSYNIT